MRAHKKQISISVGSFISSTGYGRENLLARSGGAPILAACSMNSRLFSVLLLLVVSQGNALADLRAGIAVRNVNPDPLLPLSGGIGAGHMATRRQGDLTVRALVLEQEGTRVAIVSADFLG